MTRADDRTTAQPPLGWRPNTRREVLDQLANTDWDIAVVGGGITGAGIVREAARAGMKVLLVERHDFAFGTSSRSSKFVHGGLRYLQHGKLGLVRDSVREREELLQHGAGLVLPQEFLVADYEYQRLSRRLFKWALRAYDWLAGERSSGYLEPAQLLSRIPSLNRIGLRGGFLYKDAQTDDARLVLRVLREATAVGACILNYVAATGLVRDDDGRVTGVSLRDVPSGETYQARARLVINATGAWADELREALGKEPRMRPLRGSHLVFDADRLPIHQPLALFHPEDRRPVAIYPWEGATVVGTTDLDHDSPLTQEPAISGDETSYLLKLLDLVFPRLRLSVGDIISTFSGVRPIVGSGRKDPSKESRDHVVWHEHGLLTVTGGKLTTFRLIALDALGKARDVVPELAVGEAEDAPGHELGVLAQVSPDDLEQALSTAGCDLKPEARARLLGRYGLDAAAVVACAKSPKRELTTIPGTHTLWVELRWAARQESVVHLDDLLLRRTRIGLLLRGGGLGVMSQIRSLVQHELGWSDAEFDQQVNRYRDLWNRSYRVPEAAAIPDWQSTRTG